MAGDDIFIKITNLDIANKIDKLIDNNRREHHAIMIHQKETNGKVKLNRVLVACLGTAFFVLSGWFATHLMSP